MAAPVSRRELADAIRRGLLTGATVGVVLFPPWLNSTLESDLNGRSSSGAAPYAVARATPRHADFGHFSPSPDARYLANWVADSADNAGADFILVDKKYASVLVFDGQARLRSISPILLGGAVGDDTVPGIGSRPLDQVQPEERTTPAGRFMGERGHNARGEDVVWVDYDAAVSMHRVLTSHPEEHRLERLASETVADNRVSWGCINVPVAFFEAQIRPLFTQHRALIYVLPEVKPLLSVFGAYDVQTKYAENK